MNHVVWLRAVTSFLVTFAVILVNCVSQFIPNERPKNSYRCGKKLAQILWSILFRTSHHVFCCFADSCFMKRHARSLTHSASPDPNISIRFAQICDENHVFATRTKRARIRWHPKHKVAGVKMFIQWNIQCVSFRHYTRTPSRLAYDECAFCRFSVCVRLMNAFSASWLAHVWKMGYWTCVKWTFNFLEIRNYNCFVDANSHLIPLFARSKW